MAAGLSLEEHSSSFQQRFWRAGDGMARSCPVQGEVISDGPLSAAEMSMEVAQLLLGCRTVEGQMFPEPLFDGRFRLLQRRLVGEASPQGDGGACRGRPLLDGIAFNIDTTCWRITACGR